LVYVGKPDQEMQMNRRDYATNILKL